MSDNNSIVPFMNDGTNEVKMPDSENYVEAIGKVDISESISNDNVSTRLVRKIHEGVKLPNVVIDIRGLEGISVNKYAVSALSSIERVNGDTTVYIATDESFEKLMNTDNRLKEVLTIAIKDLISDRVKVYEDFEEGKKLKKIGGNNIRSMRLNI